MAALHVFQPFVDKENPIEGGSGIARLKSRGAVPRNLRRFLSNGSPRDYYNITLIIGTNPVTNS